MRDIPIRQKGVFSEQNELFNHLINNNFLLVLFLRSLIVRESEIEIRKDRWSTFYRISVGLASCTGETERENSITF